MDLKIRINEIQVLLNEKKFSKAINKCEKLTKKFPENSYFFNLLGLILQSSGQIQKSIRNFQKALEIEQNNFAAMNNLANSYKKLFQYDKAEYFYKKIILKDSKNIKALNNYANLKKDLNKYKDAIKLLLVALKSTPTDINILYNLASCCQSLGEMNEAKKYANKILDLDPDNSSAHKFISNITNYQKEPDHLEKLKKLLAHKINTKFTTHEKIDLFFALGKAYEDIKDYKNAYKYFNEANIIVKKNSNFDIKLINKLFTSIINFFESLDNFSPLLNKSPKKIIFICGMPRSGTTLIEQIVASHNEVSGGGELQYLQKIINDNFIFDLNLDSRKILEEMKKEKNIVLEKYLEYLNFHEFKSNVITDKAPQNFIWIGFIKIFFPNSKIIHCKRNPKDNCLSLFKNYFDSNTMAWAYDQKNITDYYEYYFKIMKFWKTKIPNFIYDANYESIVNSPESEIKKMLSFCDLNWDPECLNFYKNKKTPVQTVSVSQASKPIYKSSVNLNKGYDKYLNEMFENLDLITD